MSGDLQALKSFLQMDEHLPSDRLPLTNWKHMRGDPNAVSVSLHPPMLHHASASAARRISHESRPRLLTRTLCRRVCRRRWGATGT